eukprot:TRINITY_DN12004_c0_g2_i1.p1 TRINITY_DN12004_c0_g2~~TRINITY_DN12004_c0_g2_i1.p1  ORF type:complete len:107 (+),score=9.95 TRINITY_DN12004_c0_g2_i1:1108-1428(+)
MQIPRPMNADYPFPNPENTPFHPFDIASALCGGDSEWAGDLLYQKELTDQYHLLNFFVCYNVEPHGHTSDLNCQRAYLLYAWGTGLSVDNPKCIYDAMVRIFRGSN